MYQIAFQKSNNWVNWKNLPTDIEILTMERMGYRFRFNYYANNSIELESPPDKKFVRIFREKILGNNNIKFVENLHRNYCEKVASRGPGSHTLF